MRMQVYILNLSNLTNTLLTTIDMFPRPNEPLVCRADMSKTLSDYVNTKLRPSIASTVEAVDEAGIMVGCVVVEHIFNATTGVIAPGASYTTSAFTYAFNGTLDNVSFANYNSEIYSLSTAIPNNRRFLTMKQPERNTHLNYHSKEFVHYFLPTAKTYLALSIQYFNTGSGTSLNKTISYGLAAPNQSGGIKRLNVSPTALFTPAELINLSHYNIQLVQSNAAGTLATPMTVKYNYTYHQDVCKPIYVHWLNKFGCFEVNEFLVIDPSLSVEKETSVMNTTTNVGGYMQDYTSDPSSIFYNELERTLNIKSNMTFKMSTRQLRDNEMKHLAAIFQARKIFIEYDDTVNAKVNFIPVQLLDNTYSMTPRRLMTENNIKTLSFKMPDGFQFDY